MLAWRLFLGPILIAVLIALFWFDGRCGQSAPVLAILALALAVRGSWELFQLLHIRFQPQFSVTACCVLSVVASNWLWQLLPQLPAAAPTFAAKLGPMALMFALAVMALFVSGLTRFRTAGNTMETLGSELVVLVYIGLFVSLTVQLRWIDSAVLGYLPLSSLVVITKCGDTAAYFTGRLLGKTKLCPLISPGKTQAGAVGALIGAAAGSWGWFQYAGPNLFGVQPGGWYWTVLYGAILGLVGLVGDLAESLIKRDVGQKDSAPLLPGFGGLLDLLDSIIFTGPIAYLLWLALPLVAA